MTNAKKIAIGIAVVAIALVAGFMVKDGFGSNTVENFPKWFYNGLFAGRTKQLSVDSSGNASTTGNLKVVGITNYGNETLSGTFAVTGTSTLAKVLTASVGSSSSSPASLGSSIAGHFVMATGSTTANASTTAITANSTILLTQEETTPIAGTTCNATTTAISISSKIAGNGFIASVETAPGVNPLCIGYLIIN